MFLATWLGGGLIPGQTHYMETSVSTGGTATTFILFVDNLLAFLPPHSIILVDNAAIHTASFELVRLGFRHYLFYLSLYDLTTFSFLFI